MKENVTKSCKEFFLEALRYAIICALNSITKRKRRNTWQMREQKD